MKESYSLCIQGQFDRESMLNDQDLIDVDEFRSVQRHVFFRVKSLLDRYTIKYLIIDQRQQDSNAEEEDYESDFVDDSEAPTAQQVYDGPVVGPKVTMFQLVTR